ncbi:MFS transporter [Roseivivax marinus]|nr:MFS transporter [Roseivivax marinus]
MLAFLKDPKAVALLLAASLTILSNMVISPALPGLEASFDGTENAALLTRLLVTAPSILVAIVAPLAGITADRFGRRRQLLFGVALFAVAGCAGAVLPTLPLILASRLVLGIAVAIVMTSQAALIGDYFSGAARGRFMGLQIAAVNFGGFAFIGLAGWLAGISPRLPFLIYGMGALILPFLLWAVVEPNRTTPEQAEGHEPEDLGGDANWPLTLGMVLVLSGLSFVLFYMIPTQMPFYLGTLGYDDPSAQAQVLAMVTLAGGFSALVFGAVRARLGRGMTPALGYLLMAGGFGVLDQAHALPFISLAALMLGGGFGLTMPTFFAIALDVAPAHRRGFASGAITTSIFLGQFLSPIFSTPMIGWLGYELTFAVAAGILLAMAAIVFGAFHRRPRPEARTYRMEPRRA